MTHRDFTSFEILEADEDTLQEYYPEIETYRGGCRYDNCRHIKEPGCAVRVGRPGWQDT